LDSIVGRLKAAYPPAAPVSSAPAGP
jgi:hypothetical protein